MLLPVSTLKTFIKNGWTIANRRAVSTELGKEVFGEIVSKAECASMANVKFDLAKVHLQKDTFQKTEMVLDDIASSYRSYAQSPVVNNYLREGKELPEKLKKVYDSLLEAINANKGSGEYVRGLSPTNKNSLETIEDVSNFVFNNKGFTSVTPKQNAAFAETFAYGKNGTVVTYDLKDVPCYNASSYETLFAPNFFKKDKFELIQEGPHKFRVVQKNNAPLNGYVYTHLDEGGTMVLGYMPEDYVVIKKSRVFIKAEPERIFLGRKRPPVEAHYEIVEDKFIKPHYHLDKIISNDKGYGTEKIKKLVKESLENPITDGRVTLDCCCIDGKTCPAGFYYKLGFRFGDSSLNKVMEDWIQAGGLREEAPHAYGKMFLPKENISQCLNYGL